MKILYGVQGTGNGHITRARVLAPVLKAAGVDVRYLFTGRAKEDHFDMEVFGDYLTRNGLTFVTENGKVNYLKTVFKVPVLGFIKEVYDLDLTEYDLVISDFEPVTAWAAKLQGKTSIGIGHQYAFQHKVPRAQPFNPSNLLLKIFAPVSVGLGVHWHHYNQFILPPIIERHAQQLQSKKDKIVVYLPFENLQHVVDFLTPFPQQQFYIYTNTPDLIQNAAEHINFCQISRENFQNDIRDCAGIICNAGFELPSEGLQLGKKLLVKPLDAQVEQLSNALVLKQLDYAMVMRSLDKTLLSNWLEQQHAVKASFPDVAQYIVSWLLAGNWKTDLNWAEEIWQETLIEKAKPV